MSKLTPKKKRAIRRAIRNCGMDSFPLRRKSRQKVRRSGFDDELDNNDFALGPPPGTDEELEPAYITNGWAERRYGSEVDEDDDEDFDDDDEDDDDDDLLDGEGGFTFVGPQSITNGIVDDDDDPDVLGLPPSTHVRNTADDDEDEDQPRRRSSRISNELDDDDDDEYYSMQPPSTHVMPSN